MNWHIYELELHQKKLKFKTKNFKAFLTYEKQKKKIWTKKNLKK